MIAVAPSTSSTPNPPPAAPLTPATYVPLPRRLLDDLRDSPAALGAYALLARLYQVAGAPIPLSPNDLRAFDPALSYGAARRALDRLADAGYALAEAQGGRKSRLLPAWGRVGGTARPWDRTAPGLGRPRHIAVVRLDDRLLDLCIGRLRPHPEHPAVVERYVALPLLTLRAIGDYALALAGLAASDPALAQLGLIDAAGRPLPLPDDMTVLAVASQHAARSGGLTPAGWRRAGFAQTPPAAPSGQALFFAPEGVIGGAIGPVIGGAIGAARAGEARTTPFQCGDSSISARDEGSHSETESDLEQEPTTTRTAAAEGPRGGGGDASPKRPPSMAHGLEQHRSGALSPRRPRPGSAEPKPAAAPPEPAEAPTAPAEPERTESWRLLRGAGVRVDIATQLAGRAPDQVRRVIAQAQARQGIRDLAAWVVSALRALPAEAAAVVAPRVSERAILFHPQLSGYERQRWLMLFRGADPADRPAILARFHSAHPAEEADGAAA